MRELNINERMKICEECPIFNPSDKTCNSNLWLNPDTNDVSTHAKIGYTRGCGCHMEFKTKSTNSHCIVGKW